MVTEFRLRKELETISASSLTPLTRVRRLVRVARQLEFYCAKLLELSRWHLSLGEGTPAARFFFASRRLAVLAREARDRARRCLQGSGSLGFGYAPVRGAQPSWEEPMKTAK